MVFYAKKQLQNTDGEMKQDPAGIKEDAGVPEGRSFKDYERIRDAAEDEPEYSGGGIICRCKGRHELPAISLSGKEERTGPEHNTCDGEEHQ